MTLCYRIEHADGSGICATVGGKLCDGYHDATGTRHGCKQVCEDKPLRLRLGLLCMAGGWNWAFTSLDALRDFFPLEKGRQWMKDNGGQLSVYDIGDTTLVGDHEQGMFKRSTAKLVTVLDLVTLKEPFQPDPETVPGPGPIDHDPAYRAALTDAGRGHLLR